MSLNNILLISSLIVLGVIIAIVIIYNKKRMANLTIRNRKKVVTEPPAPKFGALQTTLTYDENQTPEKFSCVEGNKVLTLTPEELAKGWLSTGIDLKDIQIEFLEETKGKVTNKGVTLPVNEKASLKDSQLKIELTCQGAVAEPPSVSEEPTPGDGDGGFKITGSSIVTLDSSNGYEETIQYGVSNVTKKVKKIKWAIEQEESFSRFETSARIEDINSQLALVTFKESLRSRGNAEGHSSRFLLVAYVTADDNKIYTVQININVNVTGTIEEGPII